MELRLKNSLWSLSFQICVLLVVLMFLYVYFTFGLIVLIMWVCGVFWLSVFKI